MILKLSKHVTSLTDPTSKTHVAGSILKGGLSNRIQEESLFQHGTRPVERPPTDLRLALTFLAFRKTLNTWLCQDPWGFWQWWVSFPMVASSDVRMDSAADYDFFFVLNVSSGLLVSDCFFKCL